MIVTYELLPQTGTSARTLGFIRALTSRGHEVKVLGSLEFDEKEALLVKHLGSEYLGALPIVCRPGVARSFVFAVNLVNVLKSLHRKFPFELVHFANYNMNALTFPFVKSLFKLPIVSDLHALASARNLEPGFQSQSLIPWLANVAYEKMALRFSDTIITPTEELKLLFGQYFAGKIVAVPNCLWLHQVDYSRKPGHEGHKEWRVFFHANFMMDRSLREAARVSDVVKLVKARGFQIGLSIAGPGSDRIGDLGLIVQNLGYVDNPNEHLSRCDLVVLPVRDLTLGLHSRLVEAMAAGKPIVATKEACCGLTPYLQDSGIRVCDSIDQMAEAVCFLLSHRDQMKESGIRNAVLAERLFSPEVVGEALEKAYVETLRSFRSKT